jgi:hypothetical protein
MIEYIFVFSTLLYHADLSANFLPSSWITQAQQACYGCVVLYQYSVYGSMVFLCLYLAATINKVCWPQQIARYS